MSTGKVLLIVVGCIVGFFLIVAVGCTALVAGSMGGVTGAPSTTAPEQSVVESADDPAPASAAPKSAPAPASKPPAAKAPAPKPPAKNAPPPKAPAPAPEMTRSQENALGSARSYLDFKGFSRAGLITQLTSEYGEDFDRADAEFAVKYLEKNDEVDWNAEAVQSAESYLDFKSFSCNGLVEQLTSEYGDKYTKKQAEYAAKKVDLC